MSRTLLLLALFGVPAAALGGGSLVGRVVVVGEVAPPAAIDPGSDACCIEAEPRDRSVLVGDDGGLANAVVYLRPSRGVEVPDSPPPPAEPAVISNSRCAFTPRVTLLRIGQPLVLANEDPATHNVNAATRRNGSFNLVLPPGDRRELLLDRPEPAPVAIRCNVHPFMRGYLFALPHPHAAVSGADGRFELRDVPAGEWRFQFWHESGELREAAFAGGRTDRRGRANLVITDGGETDLGDLRVPAERLR